MQGHIADEIARVCADMIELQGRHMRWIHGGGFASLAQLEAEFKSKQSECRQRLSALADMLEREFSEEPPADEIRFLRALADDSGEDISTSEKQEVVKTLIRLMHSNAERELLRAQVVAAR